MVSFEPAPGEKVILDEDCAEDKLRNGILVLTDKRLVFQKTQGRMATLSKKEGEVALDIPLSKISSVKAEGFLVKKIVVVSDGQTYKFGVFSNTKWERQIKQLIGAS
ncbi:MAG TPA: PH domain-containing protein [Nitrososphaera sp.]